eukprot:g25002.t1
MVLFFQSHSCRQRRRPCDSDLHIMKCFQRMLVAYISSSLPACLDPLQFAYQQNGITVDAISQARHTSLDYLDNKNTHFRLLLIDYTSAFNNIIST